MSETSVSRSLGEKVKGGNSIFYYSDYSLKYFSETTRHGHDSPEDPSERV